MKNKWLALIIAFTITLSGAAYTLYQTRGEKSDVKGISTTTVVDSENQSQRLPENKINIDNQLISLGKTADLTIVEIVDVTFVWKADANDYEILGKGISIDNSSSDVLDRLLSHLKISGFTQDSLNTYKLDHKNHYGFRLEDNVCIVRNQQIETNDGEGKNASAKTEIRCGLIDYSRIKEL